jgi:hypothetical protein
MDNPQGRLNGVDIQIFIFFSSAVCHHYTGLVTEMIVSIW